MRKGEKHFLHSKQLTLRYDRLITYVKKTLELKWLLKPAVLNNRLVQVQDAIATILFRFSPSKKKS